MKSDLRLDWIAAKDARYAVEKWHYSHNLPPGKNAYIGIWERGKFIGAIVFGQGASATLNSPFGIPRSHVAELVRIAMSDHDVPVSRVVSIAVRMIRRKYDRLRLIVSFADPIHGHTGAIYQAAGWIYTGQRPQRTEYLIGGEIVHHRAFAGGNFGGAKLRLPPNAAKIRLPGTHRYVLPLDDEMWRLCETMRKPHPKRAGSADGGTVGYQPTGGGSTPTPALIEEFA